MAAAAGEGAFCRLLLMAMMAVSGTGLFAQEATALPAPPLPEVKRITVEEAVDMALKNNLSLESSRVALDTKKRKSDLVWNQFLPSLDVRGTLARDNEAGSVSATIPIPQTGMPVTIPGIGGGILNPNFLVTDPMDLPQWHVQGNFSASLTLSAALAHGIKSIKMDYETGLLTYEKAKLQLERDVRKSYYQMLLVKENIALLRESFETAQRRATMAQTNYRNGLVPEVSYLQAQVTVENMKPTIDQAENGLKLAMASFAMNLGLPYDTDFELEPIKGELNFIPLDVAELIHKASIEKPDIVELRQSLATLKTSRTAQAFQLWTPYLNLSWGITPMFSPALDPWKESWFNKDNWSSSGSFSITLGMNLNGLLPFTKEGQGLKDVDNNIRTLSIGLAQAIRGTEIEVYNTLFSLEQARVNTEAQRYTVNLADRTYRLMEQAYRAGLSELLEVQNAELELRRARIGILEQNFNYINGLVDLEYAIGVPFGSLSNWSEK
jgi:outer membrane protein TolC